MSYKVFTQCLQKQGNAELLSRVVATICDGAQGHIQGVHVIASDADFVTLGPYFQGVPLTSLYERYIDMGAKIKAEFEQCETTHERNITWDWHQYDGASLSDFQPYVNHAIVSDLAVCCKDTDLILGRDLPRKLVQESDAPVLVVPDNMDKDNPLKRVTIAWNETPESGRAIRDALPFLKQAELVVLVNLSRRISETELKGTYVARYLGEHDIQIEIDQKESHVDIGGEMLKHISDNYMDLLVMGGYGHSSLYNMVFGAATPHVLHDLNCPVLLSR